MLLLLTKSMSRVREFLPYLYTHGHTEMVVGEWLSLTPQLPERRRSLAKPEYLHSLDISTLKIIYNKLGSKSTSTVMACKAQYHKSKPNLCRFRAFKAQSFPLQCESSRLHPPCNTQMIPSDTHVILMRYPGDTQGVIIRFFGASTG